MGTSSQLLKLLVAIAFVAVVAADNSTSGSGSGAAESGSIIIDRLRPDYHVFIGKLAGIQFYCHGAIISKDWIVTSATCVTEGDGKTKNKLQMATKSPKQGEGEVNLYDIEDVVIHPSFARLTKKYPNEEYKDVIVTANDIALLRVQKPISFHSKCKPVQIYDESKTLDGQIGVVSGWYLRDMTKQSETDKILITPQPSCEKYLEIFFSNQLDISNRICTETKAEGGYWWRLEIGAPLIVMDKLAGIASWSPVYPDNVVFYTEAAKYKSWIKEVTGV